MDLSLPALDRDGQTLDFMLSGQRDEAAVAEFFNRAINHNGGPDKVVIGKSGTNQAGLDAMNVRLILAGWYWLIEVLQVKYLNNIIERDHRFIKKITRPMRGFKSFAAAHMIRKGRSTRKAKARFCNFPHSQDQCVCSKACYQSSGKFATEPKKDGTRWRFGGKQSFQAVLKLRENLLDFSQLTTARAPKSTPEVKNLEQVKLKINEAFQ